MLIDINLLPNKQKRSISFMLFPIVGVTVLLLVFGWMVVSSFQLKAEQERLTDRLEKTTELVTVLQATEANGVSSGQTLQEYVDWLDGVQFSTVDLLDDLVARLPERGYFMNYEFDGSETVTLTVQFDQMKEVSQYLNELNESDKVQNASLLTVSAAELSEEIEDNSRRILPRYVTDYEININKSNLKMDEEEEDNG
jgi:type IV pilus assembly protein PilN